MGRTGACPLVGGIESCLSGGGQGCVREYSLSDSCVLRTTLSSLSADGWSCVPTLLVVWLETAQNWSQPPVGWGQVQEGSCQGLRPPVSLSSQWATPPTSTGHHLVLAGESDPISDEVTAFYPDAWCARDLMYTLQEWSFSFPQSYGIPAIKPHWPSKANFTGGSSSHCQTPKLGTLTWAQNFHSRWENFGGVILFQFVGHLPGVYGIWFYQIMPPTISLWLLLCVWM